MTHEEEIDAQDMERWIDAINEASSIAADSTAQVRDDFMEEHPEVSKADAHQIALQTIILQELIEARIDRVVNEKV